MKTAFRPLIFLALLTSVAGAETLPLPPADESVVGSIKRVRSQASDTLLDLARRHGYGYAEVVIANPDVDPWLPGEATIVLPGRYILPAARREGIVINIPEMRLYYFPPPGPGFYPHLLTYPVGIGKEGWRTPEIQTRVIGKEKDPVWRVPASIKGERAAEGISLPDVVPAGEGNPLGEYALRLGRPNYLIHGSNKKYGIGMRVSHGCIRLGPDDIRQLYAQVVVGTPVHVVNQPYKAGVHAGRLYLEAHPPLAERGLENNITDMVAAIIGATREMDYDADWGKAFRVVKEATGIPVAIGSARPRAGGR